MIIKEFYREIEPNLDSLADSIRSLLAVANAGSFNLDYDPNTRVVRIAQGDWTGVDLEAVQKKISGTYDYDEKPVEVVKTIVKLKPIHKIHWLVTIGNALSFLYFLLKPLCH